MSAQQDDQQDPKFNDEQPEAEDEEAVHSPEVLECQSTAVLAASAQTQALQHVVSSSDTSSSHAPEEDPSIMSEQGPSQGEKALDRPERQVTSSSSSSVAGDSVKSATRKQSGDGASKEMKKLSGGTFVSIPGRAREGPQPADLGVAPPPPPLQTQRHYQAPGAYPFFPSNAPPNSIPHGNGRPQRQDAHENTGTELSSSANDPAVLIQATLVPQESMGQPHPLQAASRVLPPAVNAEPHHLGTWKRWVFLLVALVILAGIVTGAVVMVLGGNTDNDGGVVERGNGGGDNVVDDSDENAVATPTVAPTVHVQLTALRDTVLQADTRQALDGDPTSYQRRAYDWLAGRLLTAPSTISLVQVTQWFVLACLFFATQGPTWRFGEATWLNTDVATCSWYSTATKNGLCDNSEDGGESMVVRLALDGNRLRGPLPVELNLLSHLEHLTLAENELVREIPPQLLSNLTDLTSLTLAENYLSGPLPDAALARLQYLQELRMGPQKPVMRQASSEMRSGFRGTLPSLAFSQWGNLRYLSLVGNQLSGALPSSIASMTNLAFLSLAQNKLEGRLIEEVEALSSLEALHLNRNMFTGSLPTFIVKLTNLQVLDLAQNDLHGPLLESIQGLTSLVEVSLHNNMFNGTIPKSWGALTTLRLLNIGRNKLTGRIPDDLCQRTLVGTLVLVVDCIVDEVDCSGCECACFTDSPTGAPVARSSDVPSLSPIDRRTPTENNDTEMSSQPGEGRTFPPSAFPVYIPTAGFPTSFPPGVPTRSPTALPLPNPTGRPTVSPTPRPILLSTSFPTRDPTPQPTHLPTRRPNVPATPFPTRNPTPQPTSSPTRRPVAPPTPFPTRSPTPQPTPSPTRRPVAPPTPFPTFPDDEDDFIDDADDNFDDPPADDTDDGGVTPDDPPADDLGDDEEEEEQEGEED